MRNQAGIIEVKIAGPILLAVKRRFRTVKDRDKLLLRHHFVSSSESNKVIGASVRHIP